MSLLQLSLFAMALLQASCSPVPPQLPAASVCEFRDRTHIFGGMPCYGRATAYCSDILLTTTTVTRSPSSKSTTSPQDQHAVIDPAPRITQAPSLTPAYERTSFDEKVQPDVGADPYASTNRECPTLRELSERTDIHSACACLVGHGPSTVTVTAMPTSTSAARIVAATRPKVMAPPPPKPKAPHADLDAPLRKGVYGTQEMNMRPYGKGAEPVPYWDKDNGFGTRG